MSTQSNVSSSSDTTIVEPTAKSMQFALTVQIEYGNQLELVHWALRDLKSKFHTQAVDSLIKESPEGYVQAMEDIEQIDELLEEMFMTMNRRHANQVYGEDRLGWSDEQKRKIKELAQRFGWEV